MSWMSRLYQTYEQAMALSNLSASEKPMPICHTIQNAHITIYISGAGEFRRAVAEKQTIILPATEKSAGRSSGEAAHPLADKLQYVAGDYAQFGGLKSAYFASYREQLYQWASSEYSHPSLTAILSYIDKKSVIKDLVAEGILVVDAENCLLTQWTDTENEQPDVFKFLPKEKGKLDQGSALVCWIVESPEIKQRKTWLDESLQEAWVKFDSQGASVEALCYVTGNVEPIAQNHPAKLRHSGDKAKLISSNDLGGYTFRGRFTDTKNSIDANGLQAASIGSITSQKAHNALRWLIQRQPRNARNGPNSEQVTVVWAVSNEAIPHPYDDVIPDFDEPDFEDIATDEAVEEFILTPDHTADLGKTYSNKLHRYMQGFKEKIAADDAVSVMILDSATPGRMGISYYRESIASEYIDQITSWHEDFAWHQRIMKEVTPSKGKPFNRAFWLVAAPTPYTIVNAVYGDILKSNEALKKTLYERLLPCIVSEAPLPTDILQRAISQAVNPHNKEFWEWERCLGVACALIRGHEIRKHHLNTSKDIPMALDTSNTSRDYLYGRLLAVADEIESFALYKIGEKRLSNAIRLMQRFADKPYTTWRTIELSLQPYIARLGGTYGTTLLDEIMNQFDANEFVLDQALSAEFLLGFHCQRLNLRKAKQKQSDTETGE